MHSPLVIWASHLCHVLPTYAMYAAPALLLPTGAMYSRFVLCTPNLCYVLLICAMYSSSVLCIPHLRYVLPTSATYFPPARCTPHLWDVLPESCAFANVSCVTLLSKGGSVVVHVSDGDVDEAGGREGRLPPVSSHHSDEYRLHSLVVQALQYGDYAWKYNICEIVAKQEP